MTAQPQIPAAYDAEQFLRLEGIEAIRKRPGMYIGGTDVKALHHLVFEVVDNSIDEAMAGYCDLIEVIIRADESITIHDNGRGIPVAENKNVGIPTLTAAFTLLHFGAKFGTGAYSTSGGLHGIGVKAVNAMSEFLVAESRREGQVYSQSFSRGYKTSELDLVRGLTAGEPNGTSVTFRGDPTVMQTVIFDYKTLESRFRQMVFLVPGVTIRLVDERITPFPRETTFFFEGGVRSFVYWMNKNDDRIHDVVSGNGEVPYQYVDGGVEKDSVIKVNFAFQYTESTNSTELAFTNTINNPDGGMHLTGLRTALTRTINAYARKSGYLKEKEAGFTGRHTLDGLTGIVSVRHPNPQFESQTKVKLLNPEVNAAVSSVVSEKFADFLELNPKEGRKIVEKCLTSLRIQDALDKQRELLMGERKSFLSNTTLPGKLADCSDRGANTEVFIVEGDSAGGSAKQARDRHFQAILPVFGKMLNTERVTLNKVLESDKIKMVIMALGAGIRDDFDVTKLRYGRIILLSDADVDGSHIRTLMLTFFYRYMRPIVTEGHLYIGQPPIFRLEYKKQVKYIYPEFNIREDELLAKSVKLFPESDKVGVQRYKGLGEMNPEQLWDTTMNPATRTLLQVTVDDAAEADRTFEMLMGPAVPPRKSFIMSHAKDATLDV